MSTNRFAFLMVPACAALLSIGCTNTNGPSGSSSTPPTAPKAPPPVGQQGGPPPSAKSTYTAAPPVGDLGQYEKMQAVIETERGNVYIEFYPKEAPKTVASFVKLAQDKYYDGIVFHRVVPHFVVQGGDPTGTGAGGPGYTLPAEFNAHKHVRGAVAMARTQDPNSAGSQFYICLEPQPALDNQYTVFGQVTRGMENVDKIQQGDHILKMHIEPKDGSVAPGGPAGAPGSPAAAAPGSPAAAAPGSPAAAAPASPAAAAPASPAAGVAASPAAGVPASPAAGVPSSPAAGAPASPAAGAASPAAH